MFSVEELLRFADSALLGLVAILLAVIARKVGAITKRRATLANYQLVGEIATLRQEIVALRETSVEPRLAHVYPDPEHDIVYFAFSDGIYLSRDDDGHFRHLGERVSGVSPYRKHVEMIDPGHFMSDG